jgi:hypothetical protein
MSDTTKTLSEQISVEPTRGKVVADCVKLVDAEVKAKSGLSGVAIKGAYGTVKKLKPKFVPEVIDALFDDWMERLEPHYQTWVGAPSGSLTEFLTARSEDVAEALLSVTDERAEVSKHKTAKKLYKKMRPKAKTNVIGAVPKLGALVESHLDGTGAEPDTADAPAESSAS